MSPLPLLAAVKIPLPKLVGPVIAPWYSSTSVKLVGPVSRIPSNGAMLADAAARADGLQGDLEMARAQATTAHDALKVVRQAQADRKGRGLLARLRAAVRGE